MTMTLPLQSRETSATPAQQLRWITAAVRVSFTWLGVRKALTPQQKGVAAEAFAAESAFLSAGKKLLDTRHAAYKDVNGLRGKVQAYWKSLTLPFPDPGVRLIRQDRVEAFSQHMAEFRDELMEAVERLESHYDSLKTVARQRLGRLYAESDYPPTLRGLFDIDWEFPNVEPPNYLQQLSPELYEQEKSRVANRFQDAVELAEQAFLGEFAKLISHLTERLSTGADGEKKVPDATKAHYAGRWAMLRLTPTDRLVTWDNSRLRLT